MFGVLKAGNMKYYTALIPVVNAVNYININQFFFIIFDTIFLCLYTLQNRILKLNINITPITKHILYKSECHLHTLADVCLFFNHMRLIVFYFRCQDRTQLPPESMCLNFVAVLVVFLHTLIPLNTKQNKLHISFVYSSKYIENHIVNLPAAKCQ